MAHPHRSRGHGNQQQDGQEHSRSDRLYIDLGCSFTHFLTEGRFFGQVDQQQCLIPSRSYSRFQFPPSESTFYSETGICTRYLHTCINRIRHPVSCVKWSPEGRRLITGSHNGEFTLWSSFGFISDSSITGHDSAIRCMTWSHDHEWMMSGDHDGKIKIWTPQVRPVRVLDGHLGQTRGVSFSPTDAKFCSGGDDVKVKVWDLATGTEETTFQGHLFDVRAVDWHPEKSLIVSGARDNLVKLWNPRSPSNKELCTLSGHKNTVNCASFCPLNGNLLLSASRDKSIRVFDLRKLKTASNEDSCLFFLDGHATEIQSTAWHPFYENVFVSGGYDGSLVFWSLNGAKVKPSMDAIIPAAHEGSIWSLDWHPLGHLLCTGSNDRTCKFWSRMLPDSLPKDFYSGYTNKGSELVLLKKTNTLPPNSTLIEETHKLPPITEMDCSEQTKKDVHIAKRQRLEILEKASIPGIGLIGEENVQHQAGIILQPVHLSVAKGEVYTPDPEFASNCLNVKHTSGKDMEHFDLKLLQGREMETLNTSGGIGSGTMNTIVTGATGKAAMQHDVSQPGAKLDLADPTQLPGPRITGFVRMYDEKKGFGFIRPHESSYPDLFTHSSDIEVGFGRNGEQLLAKHDLVVCRPEKGQNKVTGGEQYKAKNIVLLEHDPTRIDDLPSDPLSQFIKGSSKRKQPTKQPQRSRSQPPASGGNISPDLLQLLLANMSDPMRLQQILAENNVDIGELQQLLAASGITM